MSQLKDQPQRECLFAQRYPKEEEDGEIFVALYRQKERLLLVTSEERGGDIEIELPFDDARGLLEALQRALKK